MMKQRIEKPSSDIYHKEVFADINSNDDVWNLPYNESYKQESYRSDHTLSSHTDYSEKLRSVISNIWMEREIKVNNNYAVTSPMLCEITHIREDLLNSYNDNHNKQVNNFIKTLFYDLSDYELHDALYSFWIEYTHLNHKIYYFDSD